MADETKTTSKSSAKKETEARDLSAAEREVQPPVVGGHVKIPEVLLREEEIKEEKERYEKGQPEVVVTIDGDEVPVAPDLRSQLITGAANRLDNHPAHMELGYTNAPNRVMTEEEAEADAKEFKKRVGASS